MRYYFKDIGGIQGESILTEVQMETDSGFSKLWRSRKFWTALLDAFISTVTLVVGVAAPQYTQVTQQVVVIWQPVFLLVIAGIAYEDAATAKATAQVAQAKADLEKAQAELAKVQVQSNADVQVANANARR